MISRRLIFAAVCALTVWSLDQVAAGDQVHLNSFIGNIPKCSALLSGRVANNLPDDFRQQPPASIFCDEVDLLKRQGSLVDLLQAHQQVDRIDGMYFALSDADFIRALCGVVSDRLHHLRLLGGGEEGADWVDRLKKCVGRKIPGAKVAAQATGQIPGISSFHPKFLLLSSDGNPRADLIISSGNPTRRSPNNLDDYLSLSISKQGRLFLWHQCVSEAFAVEGSRVDAATMEDAYHLCSLAHLSSADEETLPYLLPFDRESFLSQFAFWAGKADHIDVISQGYNSLDLANILKTAAESGTKVRMVRDDDLLISGGPSVEGEVLNSIGEYYAWDRRVCGPNVSTKFLLTNSSVNYLHSKFAVFSGRFGKVALFGSANFTHAALHSNIENVYFSRNPEGASKFQEYYNNLWDNFALTASETNSILGKIGPFVSAKRINYDECDK